MNRQDAVNFLKELQFKNFSAEAIVLFELLSGEKVGLVIKTIDGDCVQAINGLVEKYGLTLENIGQVLLIKSKRGLDEI